MRWSLIASVFAAALLGACASTPPKKAPPPPPSNLFKPRPLLPIVPPKKK